MEKDRDRRFAMTLSDFHTNEENQAGRFFSGTRNWKLQRFFNPIDDRETCFLLYTIRNQEAYNSLS